MTPQMQLVLQGCVALSVTLIYAFVARVVARRETSADARLANMSFATWWAAIGALELLTALYAFPAAFGYRNLPLAATVVQIMLVLVALAIGSLVYYLVYLYTGNRRWFGRIALAYACLAVALVYLFAWMQPTGFDEALRPGALEYMRELSGPVAIAFGLVFSVPVIVAAIAYGTLYFRTDSVEAKFRISVVAVSFGAWFGWSAISTVLQLAARFPNSMALFTINSAITLLAPIVILMAYHPPPWIRARIQSRQLEGELS